ncbi:EscT/YscT/HrcT family type III secretion system export apparatus protein (plasmid) [Enterobacteriaceae bacterium Kacie_13]|nr:EscT/YscT/HrcT family type III secretion system export apparatus protein [Enterobacteriaceae bacterium Kacie_13]
MPWTLWIEHPMQLSALFLRPLGIFVMFPILSSKSLGGAFIRNALIIACILPVVPVLMSSDSPMHLNVQHIDAVFVMQEMVIGLIIGFVAAIPFWALDSAGFLIDTIRGSSLSSVLNPSLGEAASVFGVLLTQLFMTLFFINGGMNQLLDTLYHSYQQIPPGADIRFHKEWLGLLLAQWEMLCGLAVSFSLPAIAIMLLVDMSMGLINRSAQQLNVFFLAMPLKSIAVLFVLIISLSASLKVVSSGQQHIFYNLGEMMSWMAR